MKTQHLFFVSLSVFLMSFTLSSTSDCVTDLSSEVHEDTASKQFLFMCKPIVNTTAQECSTLDILFTTKEGAATTLDLSNVFSVNYYMKNEAGGTLQFSFCSLDNQGNEQWTTPSTISFEPSTGRYQSYANALLPNSTLFTISKVFKMKLIVTTSSTFLLDEIALEYYVIEKQEPDFEVQKQLKTIKKKFKDKEKEEHEKQWFRDHGNVR